VTGPRYESGISRIQVYGLAAIPSCSERKEKKNENRKEEAAII
jgi:hypothetical protein